MHQCVCARYLGTNSVRHKRFGWKEILVKRIPNLLIRKFCGRNFFTEALEDETTKKRFPKNINFILRSHCWASSWGRQVKVVQMRRRPSPISWLKRPPQAVGGRAVVQARRRGTSTPTRSEVRSCVRVTQWRAWAAGPRSAVRHYVLTDGRGAVKVLGLVAVDDHTGVVRPGPATWVPDCRALFEWGKKFCKSCLWVMVDRKHKRHKRCSVFEYRSSNIFHYLIA